MVQLDHKLIDQARRLTRGDNIHRMKMYIFLYEQAVVLHNCGHPKHATYYEHYEKLLREYVRSALPAWFLCEELRWRTHQAIDIWKRSQELRLEINEASKATPKAKAMRSG